MSDTPQILSLDQFKNYLQPRPREANKSFFGHLLIVGGDYGFSGAVQMAGEAALRGGAGLVSIATRPEHAINLNIVRPELMCHGIKSAADLEKLLAKANAVVMGPGMGKSSWAKKLLYQVLKSKLNVVVDADALNLMAVKPIKKSNWILTPHPGEAGRLLKKTAIEIQQDRTTAARNLQNQYGGICVLKGAGTLVLGAEDDLSICRAGNPGMATAGTGDILSGIIGSLLVQGLPLIAAAQFGVLIHATAGDMAAKEGGERGMIATDLLPYIRRIVN